MNSNLLCSVAYNCAKRTESGNNSGGLMEYFHIFLSQCFESLKEHTQKFDLMLNLLLVFVVVVVIECNSDLAFKFLN